MPQWASTLGGKYIIIHNGRRGFMGPSETAKRPKIRSKLTALATKAPTNQSFHILPASLKQGKTMMCYLYAISIHKFNFFPILLEQTVIVTL